MIMPGNTHNFDQLSEEVSSAFFKGKPLNDGVVEVALREKLNPEEVKRLVEKSNVAATVKTLKISTDKQIQFELADYDEVIKKTHPEKSTTDSKPAEHADESSPSEVLKSLPDMYSETEKVKLIEPEKTASEKERNYSSEIFKNRQRIEELHLIKVSAETRVLDGIDALVSEFEQWRGPDFGKFASQAYTIDGNASIPVINEIAAMLKTNVRCEKYAGYIDTEDPLMAKYASIISALKDIVNSQREIDSRMKKNASLWAEVAEGENSFIRSDSNHVEN